MAELKNILGRDIGNVVESTNDDFFGLNENSVRIQQTVLNNFNSNLEDRRETLYSMKLLQYYTWFEGNSFGLKEFYTHLPDYTFRQLGLDEKLFWRCVPRRSRAFHVATVQTVAVAMGDLLFASGVEVGINKKKDLKEDELEKHEKKVETLKAKWAMIRGDERLTECCVNASWAGTGFLKWDFNMELSNLPMLNVVNPLNARVYEDMGVPYRFDFFEMIKVNKTNYKQIEVREVIDGKLHINFYFDKWDGYQHMYKDKRELDRITKNHESIIKSINLKTEFNKDFVFETDDLLALAVPNKKPDITMKSNNYGASDFSGLLSIADAIDEVYSTWMESIRKGKIKRYIPDIFLMRDEEGGYKGFDDFDNEFTVISSESAGIADQSSTIQIDEPDIDIERYKETYHELLNDFIIKCGIAPYSLGQSSIGLDGRDLSDRRERFSQRTREKKRKIWEPLLNNLIRQFVILDRLFNKKSNRVEFKDVSEYFAKLKAYHIPTLEGRMDLWGDARRNNTVDIYTMVNEIYLDMTPEDKAKMIANIRAEARADSADDKERKIKNENKRLKVAARNPFFNQQDGQVPQEQVENTALTPDGQKTQDVENNKLETGNDKPEKETKDKENKGDNKAKGIVKKEKKGL